jgi:hypothetical protein
VGGVGVLLGISLREVGCGVDCGVEDDEVPGGVSGTTMDSLGENTSLPKGSPGTLSLGENKECWGVPGTVERGSLGAESHGGERIEGADE